MCLQNVKVLIRRYHVFGSRTLSNYWWGILSLIGGFCFFLAGLYSYYLTLFATSPFCKVSSKPATLLTDLKEISAKQDPCFANPLFSFFQNNFEINSTLTPPEISFFPQGLSMCFYGLIGILLGTFLFFCITFQIGCGFTEFNKEKGAVRIFRLGFPGKNRYIDYSYNLESIQCICVKISRSIAPSSERGVYMRLKLSENQIRDIPLDLYSEKTSLEEVELQAADLSKFLRVSLSIL